MRWTPLVSMVFLAGCNSMPSAPSAEMSDNISGQPDGDQAGEVGLPISSHDVVDAVLGATWQVIAYNSASVSFATAFAVDSVLLASNAHVVQGVADILAAPDGVAVAVQHETGDIVYIVDMWIHADYDGELATSPDVGVFEVDATLPVTLDLASDSALQDLGIFDEVSLCGFPFDVTLAIDIPAIEEGEFRPRATCLNCEISSLRPFDASEAATPENTQLIQYAIATTEGTSGSALFDEFGRVVAINAGGTVDEAGLNRFAARADTLRDLLNLIDSGFVDPVVISEQQEFEPGEDDLPSDPTDDGVASSLPSDAELHAGLEGQWVMRLASTGDVWACLEFNAAGELVVYNVLCHYFESLGRLNHLDAIAPTVVEDGCIGVVFNYTLVNTAVVVLTGCFVSVDEFDAYYVGSDGFSINMILTRESFPQ